MKRYVFILVTVLLIGVSGEDKKVVHKYSSDVFTKAQKAGVDAAKVIEEAKTKTEAEKRYIFDQANDFYHYISNAAYILNKAVYGGHLDAALRKRLSDVTKDISEETSFVLRAINEAQEEPLKQALVSAIENATKEVGVLSQLASDVDNVYGLKLIEGDIYRATKALLRGFFQMTARFTFFGKTQQEIEAHVLATGVKCIDVVSRVTGTGKHVAHVLKNPASNLADLLDRVLIRINDLLFDEETVTNAVDIRKVYNELAKLYGETVDLKIRFGYEEDGEKLKTDLNKCSEKTGALLKQLTDLLQGAAGKEIVEEVLPQTETGVLFLFYYLDLYKVK